ncbi:hypothetical protein QX776_10495 [Alteromonadaceae bacterium BrNp21-10]|nr:hypothetical protein [Alteromonadaceae bacterium BrNp21-10]
MSIIAATPIRFFLVIIPVIYVLTINSVSASDLYQADQYFQQAEYAQAKEQYLLAANVGSAHAFYQLGVIHYKGLGEPANSVKALVWFSLAAEQQFNDAQQIVDDLMALATPAQQTELQQLQNQFRQQYGFQSINNALFPIINTSALGNKITFGEENALANQFSMSDMEFNDLSNIDFVEAPDMDDEASIQYLLLGRPDAADIRNRPYSAVVDYEVGADGSVRNMETMRVMGRIQPALNELVRSNVPSPQFAAEKVSFVNRAYLGVAGYNQVRIRRDQYQRFYYRLMRNALKLKKSQIKNEQFQYATLLMTFQWLPQEENELDDLLKTLSEAGHPLAQYEYGLKLYREQKDIPQAIRWLNEASKFGVAKAQYRLGRLMLDSPWVLKDETKALFWFERAAAEQHDVAQLKAAELKLMAVEPALHNLQEAQQLLATLPESQHRNPEYEYLQAAVDVQVQPRKLAEAVEHLRDAIDLADNLNWDVSEWQKLLEKWTSGGKVTVSDL